MNLDLGFVEIKLEITLDSRKRKIRRLVSDELLRTDGNERVFAVKKYRELTGSSLKESVDYVNSLLPEGDKIGQRFK